jgi:hypothetical protein
MEEKSTRLQLQGLLTIWQSTATATATTTRLEGKSNHKISCYQLNNRALQLAFQHNSLYDKQDLETYVSRMQGCLNHTGAFSIITYLTYPGGHAIKLHVAERRNVLKEPPIATVITLSSR